MIQERPPTPERIAQWEAQALALLSTRMPPEKLIAHLKSVGCPPDLAEDILSRNRAPAKRALQRKGLGILLTGVGIVAGIALLAIFSAATGIRLPFAGRAFLFVFAAIAMIAYGGLQLLFG